MLEAVKFAPEFGCAVADAAQQVGSLVQLRASFELSLRPVPSEELAINVENLSKSYENGKPVINNLSMKVERGTIYSLLGASGCGKSSLLSCMVGLTKWDDGDIFLFGRRVQGVAGQHVGYMPQDTALCDQLSLREMMVYYGQLYGMPKEMVKKEVDMLINLLHLPKYFKLVKHLSGGMKRRCSLAITLIHRPKLLILDEPTVGLDPLLSKSIWEYLASITQTRKQTVLITTHYIDEARNSNKIGVMRNGRMIVEESPAHLLQKHNCLTLEQVVLKLCQNDEGIPRSEEKQTKDQMGPSSPKNSYKLLTENQVWFMDQKCSTNSNHDQVPFNPSSTFDRTRAFSKVVLLTLLRHPVFMVMVLFLPAIQMLLSLAVLGTHPKDLKFGVVNNDLPFDVDCSELLDSTESHIVQPFLQSEVVDLSSVQYELCDFKHLSCKLITELGRSGTLKLIRVKSIEQAHDKVMMGDLWGYFSFPFNYSAHLEDLILLGKFAENETLEGSVVHMRLDMSDYIAAAMAIQDSYRAYQNFVGNVAKGCNQDFTLPMMYRKPVYGKDDSSYHDYVIPVVIISVICEIPMIVTAIILIKDRKNGTLDRARVAGLCFKEILISHTFSAVLVTIGQTVICTVVMWLTYGFEVEGSWLLYFLILLLCGLYGVSYGILTGVAFKTEVEALMFALLLLPTFLYYEGTFWPIEGMTPVVRTICYFNPTTLTIRAFRSIIYKGTGLTDEMVWPGIAVISAYICILFAAAGFVFKVKYRN